MNLFRSFKSLILLLVIGVLVVATLAFVLFTREEVARAMLGAENESARNVRQAVLQSIAAQYRDLQFFKQYALERYRRQVCVNVQIALAAIDHYRRMAGEGKLTEEQAKQSALRYISGLSFGSNADYCFIYDSNQVAIAHPDPTIYGRNMSGVKDVQGRSVQTIMRGEVRTNGAGYCTLSWHRLGKEQPAEKLVYLVHYPAWDWIIGSGIYIDDIEDDARSKMNAIMETLQATFTETRILETGYFWLFNGRGEILIPPRPPAAFFSGTGTNLFAALVRAAHHPDRPYYYLDPGRVQAGQDAALICAHVQHFAPLDWFIVSSVNTDEMWRPVRHILWKQAVFALILLLVFILSAVGMVHRVTRPLERLTLVADRLHQNDFILPAASAAELKAIVFPREIGRLAHTLDSMVQKLEEYLKHLAESAAARERIQSELRIAHDIQMSMLPDSLPESAGRGGIDLHAALMPASAVGGDLYDFFMLDDRRLCVTVGDVSDKGIPAALFMARSKALLRAVAAERPAPDYILTQVNEELNRGNKLFVFVTAFLGILDLSSGDMQFSNAGHPPPYLLRSDGTCHALRLIPHKPLGIVSRVPYAVEHTVLAPGDSCFIYTDGITEAVNARDELFGAERLQATLAGLTGAGAREIVETVLRAVAAFTGGVSQNDDIAALALRRRC